MGICYGAKVAMTKAKRARRTRAFKVEILGSPFKRTRKANAEKANLIDRVCFWLSKFGFCAEARFSPEFCNGQA